MNRFAADLDRYLTEPPLTFCDCGEPNEDHDSDTDCESCGACCHVSGSEVDGATVCRDCMEGSGPEYGYCATCGEQATALLSMDRAVCTDPDCAAFGKVVGR